MEKIKNIIFKIDDLDLMILYGLLIVEQVRSTNCECTSDEIREAQNSMVKQLEQLQGL